MRQGFGNTVHLLSQLCRGRGMRCVAGVRVGDEVCFAGVRVGYLGVLQGHGDCCRDREMHGREFRYVP